MAVREFDAGEHIDWSVGTGGLNEVLFGAFTVAAICKRSLDLDQGAVLNLAAGVAGSRGFFRYTDDDQLDYLRGQFQSPSPGPLLTVADDWVLVAFTKAAGPPGPNKAVRYHKYVFATDSWTHIDSSGTVGNDDLACDRASTRYQETDGWAFQGRYAVMGVWGSVLSDATLEGLTTTFADWEAAAPMTLWRFDQAATTDAIDDQTGNGANQTALVGSSVVAGDDPPGFSFGAGGITGTLAVTEAADTLAASGTVTPPAITGTLAVTEADDTLAGSGTVTPPAVTGTLAVTEADDTLAASGTTTPPSVTGTLAVTEAADTLVASGTVTSDTITGSLAAIEEPDTLTASGTFTPATIGGMLSVTEQADTLTASGSHNPPGGAEPAPPLPVATTVLPDLTVTTAYDLATIAEVPELAVITELPELTVLTAVEG